MTVCIMRLIFIHHILYVQYFCDVYYNFIVFLNITFTVWRAQSWPPCISFIQVFDRFLTSLMDRMIKSPRKTETLSSVDCALVYRKWSTAIKLVRNLSKTCAKLMWGGHGWMPKTVNFYLTEWWILHFQF